MLFSREIRIDRQEVLVMIMKLYAKKKWRVVLQALACILIMSGTFVALTHRNAGHASGSATIKVSPASGAYLSGPISVTGANFRANESVQVAWNYTGPGTGTLLASPTGDSNGSFSAGASVPTGTAAGHISIAGVGQTSNTVAKFTFTLYPSLLTLAPLRGSSNSPLTLSAYGFKGGEQVSIYWNNGITPLRTVSTNGFGYMSPLAITVPAKTPPGNYPVKVVGQTSTSTITNTYT